MINHYNSFSNHQSPSLVAIPYHLLTIPITHMVLSLCYHRIWVPQIIHLNPHMISAPLGARVSQEPPAPAVAPAVVAPAVVTPEAKTEMVEAPAARGNGS